MADHYRGLIKSLMKLGFLFKRQGERKHEIWRNRLTEQHVMFDRQAVSSSRAAVAAVLKEASTPVEKPAAKRTARAKRPAAGRAAGTAAVAARSKARRRTKRIAGTPAKSKSAVKRPPGKKPSMKKASATKAPKSRAKTSRTARRRTR